MKLIGQDAQVTLSISTLQGITPNFSGAASIMAFARSIREQEGTETVNVAAIGDKRDKTRVKRGNTRIELELLVDVSGPIAHGMIGHYAQVVITPLSGLGAISEPYVGVITERSLDVPDNEQIERLVIMCDAD